MIGALRIGADINHVLCRLVTGHEGCDHPPGFHHALLADVIAQAADGTEHVNGRKMSLVGKLPGQHDMTVQN